MINIIFQMGLSKHPDLPDIPLIVDFARTDDERAIFKLMFARQVMARNNKHGIFSNEADDLDGLNEVLSSHLREPSLVIVGCVGLFSGLV